MYDCESARQSLSEDYSGLEATLLTLLATKCSLISYTQIKVAEEMHMLVVYR